SATNENGGLDHTEPALKMTEASARWRSQGEASKAFCGLCIIPKGIKIMKLFTFATSPYARKVRIVLDYKGIAYEPLERCYSLDRKEDLREANIRAEVPVVVLDDGRTIADSTIICEYLEQVYPQPATFPDDPYQRARMRRIEDLCDRTFDAIGFGYFLGVLRQGEPEAEAIKQAARAECLALLGVFERELEAGGEYFCGRVGLADFAAICHVPITRAMEIGLDAFPRLAAWSERMRRLPAVAADRTRASKAWQGVHNIAAEFEGPDGKIHWRDSRLEWPIRHGFGDLVMREFHAAKMMFPPDAA
ncbi:MAG TPA: glutathione S-transferase family protein, partial [Candidatus Binataceae bacterium]|nr:glutathione S-transferase family protein [Candidatus Binataceae bacterium]